MQVKILPLGRAFRATVRRSVEFEEQKPNIRIHMVSSLNYGPFQGPYYKGAVLFLEPKRGTLLQRATHVDDLTYPNSARQKICSAST